MVRLAVGVPEITHVVELIVKPVGSVGMAPTAQFVIADPLLFKVGVAVNGIPTVPVSVVGKLMLGLLALTPNVNVAVVDPPVVFIVAV